MSIDEHCEGPVNMSGVWLCTSQELAKANQCKYLNQNGYVNYGGLVYSICEYEKRNIDFNKVKND